jgi:branched-chain amino acid transport system substrate-binding protein
MPAPRTTFKALLTLACAYAAMASPISAATIGVVAPKSGPYALLGEQVFQGARAAAEANGDTLVEVEETCDEAGGTAAAKALEDSKVSFAIGFLCVETLTTAMPVLAEQAIPAITVSVRSRILMEDALRNGWPLFRLAPAEGTEAEQIAAVISDRWKADPIAFIDDGTIYGRELVNAVRQTLEPLGIRPVFNDTMRPGQEQQIALVRRLQKAGATHVLIGADRNDVAIIARDAAAENAPLTVLGGDAMRAANRPVALRDGALAVALPSYQRLPTATDTATILIAGGVEPEGNVLPAYAAVQIASRAAELTTDGKPTVQEILNNRFETVIGEIAFRPNHELADNPYRLLVWQGSDFASPVPETE